MIMIIKCDNNIYNNYYSFTVKLRLVSAFFIVIHIIIIIYILSIVNGVKMRIIIMNKIIIIVIYNNDMINFNNFFLTFFTHYSLLCTNTYFSFEN